MGINEVSMSLPQYVHWFLKWKVKTCLSSIQSTIYHPPHYFVVVIREFGSAFDTPPIKHIPKTWKISSMILLKPLMNQVTYFGRPFLSSGSHSQRASILQNRRYIEF